MRQNIYLDIDGVLLANDLNPANHANEFLKKVLTEYPDTTYWLTTHLTFDYAHEPVVNADLILCAPVVAQEALAQGLTLEAHYAHLLVHGTLHAQGYDHEDEADAAVMEAREIEIVMALGFDDPYARAPC